MKSLINKTIVLFLLINASSCNDDFFELTNPPEFPWLNVTELERGAVSPYNIAFASSWSNFFGDAQLILECMSDQVYLLPNTSADIPFNEMYFRTTDTEINKANSVFSSSYKAIGACNSIIDFLDANNDEPYPDLTPEDRANIRRIKGEAYLMRAYSYFHVVRIHAPAPSNPKFSSEKILPLRLSFPTSYTEANEPEYVTAQKIYEVIISDLTAAKEHLPEQYEPGLHHPSYQYGRANRYAAAALLARVYFMTGNYDGALSELDYVIAGPYALDEDPIAAFNRSNASQGNEVIWYALYYDAAKGSTQKVATSMNYSDYRAINGGRGADHRRCTWHQFTFSHYLLKQVGWMYNDLSVTDEAKNDKRYQQLFWRLEPYRGDDNDDPRYYDLQYKHIKTPQVYGDKYFRGQDGQFTNVPIIRLAEMYLTRSIIYLKKGNNGQALEDLNIVRTRAGLDPLNMITESDIHNERIKELAFEGDRLFYLQALNLPVPPGDRTDAQPVTPPYENFYWRLPQSELDFRTDN